MAIRPPVLKSLNVIGQRVSTCQLKLPGVTTSSLAHVVDASTRNSSSCGSTTIASVASGNGRANQAGTHLVDREPQVGHRIEIQILEGADGPHQRPQHRQVLQLRRHAQFDRAFAALLVLAGFAATVIGPPSIV